MGGLCHESSLERETTLKYGYPQDQSEAEEPRLIGKSNGQRKNYLFSQPPMEQHSEHYERQDFLQEKMLGSLSIGVLGYINTPLVRLLPQLAYLWNENSRGDLFARGFGELVRVLPMLRVLCGMLGSLQHEGWGQRGLILQERRVLRWILKSDAAGNERGVGLQSEQGIKGCMLV